MKKMLATFSLLLFTATPSMAAWYDDVRLGNPSYGGSGCPQGTASTALSPDAKSLSILFDEYIVEAGGRGGRRTARKACNVAIPVHVPQGFSVSIFKIDMTLPEETASPGGDDRMAYHKDTWELQPTYVPYGYYHPYSPMSDLAAFNLMRRPAPPA